MTTMDRLLRSKGSNGKVGMKDIQELLQLDTINTGGATSETKLQFALLAFFLYSQVTKLFERPSQIDIGRKIRSR